MTMADRSLRRWAVVMALVAAALAAVRALARFRRRRRKERLGGDQSPGRPVEAPTLPTGDGLYLVGNPDAGPAISTDPTDELEERLPDAVIHRLTETDDLSDLFEKGVANGARVLGVAGGDGSVSCASDRAVAHDLPLLVVPGGTLNHLARDLGVKSAGDGADALAAGRAVAMDVGEIDGKTFLNTASFGGYVEMVDAREQLERFLGKWPAVLVALVRVLRRFAPMEVELDGRRRKVWLVFVGNGVYDPQGFVPNRRYRLDDGQLDVRLVEGNQPFARLRLVAAVLTGTLHRSRVYDEFCAERLAVRSHSGPVRLALDGETGDGPEEFVIVKRPRALTVYTPAAVTT